MTERTIKPAMPGCSEGYLLESLFFFALMALPALAHATNDSPVFTNQPGSIMVTMGGTVRLAASATGSQPIAYIWQQNGVFLGGSTNATLVITNAQPAHSGNYALVAANAFGVARSDPARVIVYTNQPCNFPWVWTALLHGPETRCFPAYVYDMAVDAAGNIFVTGHACVIETGGDYLTAKFDRTGHLLWTARFSAPNPSRDTPRGLALDAGGNCYVTGYSYASDPGRLENVTIKYASNGMAAWTNLSLNNGVSIPAIAVDAEGHAYITSNTQTIGIDFNGLATWTNSTGGETIKLSPDGQAIYITTPQGRSLSRIDTAGNLLWSVATPDTSQYLSKLAVDNAGNAYVSGFRGYDLFATVGDIETVKFDGGGNRLWTAIYDGPGHGPDQPTALCVGSNGCVYVAGTVWNTNRPVMNGSDLNPMDVVTLKYGADGQLLWASTYNGPHNGRDVAYSIAADAQGCVYVAGSSDFPYPASQNQIQDAFVVKYDTDGNQLWVSRYDVAPSGIHYSFFLRMALDSEGNVIVGGASAYLYQKSQTYLEFLVVKFDQHTPRLTPGRVVAPGVRQGCLVSSRGSAFEIQATTDFQTWQPVDTLTNFNGLVPFFDRDSGPFPHRFYRAMQLGNPAP